MKKDSLRIKTVDNVLVVSTLDMWEGLQVEHKALMDLIRKYKTEFSDIRLITFEKVITNKRGKPQEHCYLDEEQAAFLITLMKNSPVVVPFKKRMTREFFRMKKFIAHQINQKANSEYLEIRSSGKLVRRVETDTVQRFVNYATEQGSTSAFRYYANISKMQNKALFLLDQKFRNVRDLLDIEQLMTVASADKIVVKAIEDGMAKKLNYKEIYQIAKQNVETFAMIHGKSSVPVNRIAHSGQKQLRIAG